MLRLNSGSFIAIPTMLVSYDCGIAFDVYIRKGGSFFLFARHGELTDAHKHRLTEHNVETLYIHSDDLPSYDAYIEGNFSNLLQDDAIPIDDRSSLLYDYSLGLSKGLLQNEGLVQPTVEHRDKLLALADNTYEFIARRKGAPKSIAKLLSHNYKTYSHCINVSIYVMLAMVKLGFDKRSSRAVGAGAALHDIGKSRVPTAILDKPGRLTPEEREVINQHPIDGYEICRDMDLDDASIDCILQHHEKLDGSGYPGQAVRVPRHVRIVTVADIYDALTSSRPYSRAYNAFEAFKIITRDAEAGRLDKEVCKEFMLILTEGQLVSG